MDDEIEKGIEKYENVPGSWAHTLKEHWIAFNAAVKLMNDNPKKVPHIKLREYILHDMLKKHEKEKNK